MDIEHLGATGLSQAFLDWSDADASIAAAMSADAGPWPQARQIITDRVPDRSAEQALAVITGSPEQRIEAGGKQ
ncbi:hypothetical protein [Actinoplanes auranticolor]|nr:hypothetical protein [Actinoplanes auranticolor]